MCTVVVRWAADEPVRVLALRDEIVGRDFDDPDAWWPEQPGVVGGRDRTAGGSWCVTDVRSGTTALVLNRPEKRLADAGAPSRGVLPLLAVRRGENWPAELDLRGMASFSLVLASPDALTCWTFDGAQLREQHLTAGTHMVTSGGAEDGRADNYLGTFTAAGFPDGWREVLRHVTPVADPAHLVVRGDYEGRTFATVFGQLLTSVPGELASSWSREPWGESPWTSRTWS